MIDRNHPAVKAANMGVQKWLAGDGPFDDDPVRLAHEMTAVCITAALPHLTADDLRDTPAGRALMAEAKREVACGLECLAARYDLSGHGEAAIGARAAAEALLEAFPKDGAR